MHYPRYIPTVQQLPRESGYDLFLLDHREPSRFSTLVSRAIRADRAARGRLRPPADFR